MQVIRDLQLLLIGFPCFQAFKKSTEVMERFIRAYQLMLRFYGIILTNQETGELERAENWAERFQNLNRWVSVCTTGHLLQPYTFMRRKKVKVKKIFNLWQIEAFVDMKAS